MPRPKLTVRTRQIHFRIQEPLAARLELYLTSEVEGRVPFGGYQVFFDRLIREFFTKFEAPKEPT